jgi:hypothetical protein
MIGIDHEYIPENAAQGDTPSERPDVQKVYCEIMQMGACKLDAAGREIDVLNVIVRAHRIHAIPLWLSRMTGMTKEKRTTGLSFPDALRQLVDFVGDDKDLWTFSGDWWVLEGNAKAHGISMPFEKPFNRLKPLLADKGITLEDYRSKGFNEVCSGGLYKVLGIDLPNIEGAGAHDAAHDARSLARSVYHLGLV